MRSSYDKTTRSGYNESLNRLEYVSRSDAGESTDDKTWGKPIKGRFQAEVEETNNKKKIDFIWRSY